MNDWRDFLIWWAASFLSAAAMVGGKLGMTLFRLASDPPADPVLAAYGAAQRK